MAFGATMYRCVFSRPPKSSPTDSPVEGRRFELSVPPEKDWPYETIVIDLRTLLVRERK